MNLSNSAIAVTHWSPDIAPQFDEIHVDLVTILLNAEQKIKVKGVWSVLTSTNGRPKTPSANNDQHTEPTTKNDLIC